MRVIDANALDFDFDVTDDLNGMLQQVGIEMAKSRVDNAPTIDPESLRPQGEWVDVYGKKYANHRYVCSHCEVDALYKIEANAGGHERYVQALSDSCPHCGANMKGAGEDAKAEIAQTVQDLRNER